ncbi:MAG: XRE family transcriptional regulator [Microbacterium sp.]|uniref:helix-turn-helix domain-containing protein n=1 Tax=Microbacterium sp. TaxID=51671 RepID=UPI0039E60F52
MTDEIQRSIGAAVRATRAERGESMRTVAERAGISQPMLSKVENAQILPSLTTVYGLAAALEVPAASLLPAVGGAGEPLHFVVDEPGPAPTAQLLSGGAGASFHVYVITGRAGDDDGRDFQHPGQEFVYVVSGVAHLRRGDQVDRVAAGESITYDGAVAHRWSVLEDARYLLVSTS